jgi:hypothetical protein
MTKEFVDGHCSLHKVVQRFPEPGTGATLGWNVPISGPATVYHCIGISNGFDMVVNLAPVRKRGRPTTREKALEQDLDMDYVKQDLDMDYEMEKDDLMEAIEC